MSGEYWAVIEKNTQTKSVKPSKEEAMKLCYNGAYLVPFRTKKMAKQFAHTGYCIFNDWKPKHPDFHKDMPEGYAPLVFMISTTEEKDPFDETDTKINYFLHWKQREVLDQTYNHTEMVKPTFKNPTYTRRIAYALYSAMKAMFPEDAEYHEELLLMVTSRQVFQAISGNIPESMESQKVYREMSYYTTKIQQFLKTHNVSVVYTPDIDKDRVQNYREYKKSDNWKKNQKARERQKRKKLEKREQEQREKEENGVESVEGGEPVHDECDNGGGCEKDAPSPANALWDVGPRKSDASGISEDSRNIKRKWIFKGTLYKILDAFSKGNQHRMATAPINEGNRDYSKKRWISGVSRQKIPGVSLYLFCGVWDELNKKKSFERRDE